MCLNLHGASTKQAKLTFLEYIDLSHLDLDVEELKKEVANETEITNKPGYYKVVN